MYSTSTVCATPSKNAIMQWPSIYLDKNFLEMLFRSLHANSAMKNSSRIITVHKETNQTEDYETIYILTVP